MESTDIKIQEALQNANEWITYLAKKPHKELERRLGINELQYQHACNTKQENLCELMNIMHRILVEARIYKDEHQIPDEPNEMELAISQMEYITAQEEERQEIVESFQSQRISKPKIQEDNSNQISLF
jgi:hypothetical protein